MDRRTFFRKAVLGAGTLTLCVSLAIGLIQPTKAVALDLGSLVGTVLVTFIQQDEVRKSLDYYENDGRHELFEQLKKSEGVSDDPHLNAMLTRIMTRLTNSIAKTEPSIKDKPYNYFINSQKEFNAFCSLGHNVSVNVGMFTFLGNNEDKVAAIVAHELVHGQKKHPIKAAKKKSSVEILQRVAGSQMGGGEKLAVDVVATHIKASGITKPKEWEADNIAFGYLTEANYNPGAPAAAWHHVFDNMDSDDSKGLLAALLNPSTHPSPKDRRDNYSKKLTAYSNNKVTVDAATGEIKINNKSFLIPAAWGDMSALERSYLIAGNLAAIYHNNAPVAQARYEHDIVKIGPQPVMQSCPGDLDVVEIVRILNKIK
ncbi:MAG: M48 family metallopeptidase [Sporomusa sp.]